VINVESLILEQCIFDVRYEKGYLYWDNCGKIFRDTFTVFPDAEEESVSVKEAKLFLKGEDLNFTFSPVNFNVTQRFPKNIKIMGDVADALLSSIIKHIDIEIASRIGNRFVYILPVANSEESVSYLKKMGLLNIPTDKLDLIGDTVKEPHVKFIVTKGDEIGYIFNLSYVSRKIEIKVPRVVKYDVSGFVNMGLSIDVDFFTMKPFELSNLKCKELIEKNEKNIRYMISRLFQ
jgi:hypothetical protein